MSVADESFYSTKRYELPDAAFLSMKREVLIEKMLDKYYLATNPFPKIMGELIIFKPKKAD